MGSIKGNPKDDLQPESHERSIGTRSDARGRASVPAISETDMRKRAGLDGCDQFARHRRIHCQMGHIGKKDPLGVAEYLVGADFQLPGDDLSPIIKVKDMPVLIGWDGFGYHEEVTDLDVVPGLLEQLPPSGPGQSLAILHTSAGQQPVFPSILLVLDQEDFLVLDNSYRDSDSDTFLFGHPVSLICSWLGTRLDGTVRALREAPPRSYTLRDHLSIQRAVVTQDPFRIRTALDLRLTETGVRSRLKTFKHLVIWIVLLIKIPHVDRMNLVN